MNLFEKLFVFSGLTATALGFLSYPSLKISALGLTIVGVGFLPRILWGGTKVTARATKNAIVSKINAAAEEARYQKEQKRREQEWQDNLKRDLQREKELAKVRNETQLESFKSQVELLVEYKAKGADIDKEVFAMREKVLVLERQENNDMIQELLSTLDKV